MNILLSNLSGVKKEEHGGVRHLVKAGSRWPMTIGFSKSVDYYPFPFYLSHSTALLKKTLPGHFVRAIDGVVNDYTSDELYDEIVKNPPDIFIAEVTFITLQDDLEFLRKLKKDFNCLLVVTGVYVTTNKEKVLEDNPFIDYAIQGEYEISLGQLVGRLAEESQDLLEDIPGLIFRKDGGVTKHPESASVKDLNQLPFPDREDFPGPLYADFAFHSPCITMTATRGCPAGCVFCVERHITYNSPKYRIRDYKLVVDEMQDCIEKFGAKQFYFDDQSFVVIKKFVLNFCDELIARNIKTHWSVMGDAMFVDYQMLQKMAQAGCIGMKFGIESSDETILKNIDKPLDTEKAVQVVKWCREVGILTHATFCVGLPGETEETIKETANYIETLNPDTAQISRAVPFPGTPLFNWAKENNYLTTNDLSLFDGAGKSVLNYPNLSAERIDHWYEKILRRVARKKLITYLMHPINSIGYVLQLCRQKGMLRTFQTVSTVVTRTV